MKLNANRQSLITRLLPFRLYVVHGESMLPTFKQGNILLGSAWIKPKVGHVVVVRHKPTSLKRITKINSSGIWVEGDNKAASTDSRSFGYIRLKEIEAVIFLKLI